jgi:divalent metal cation (Fe/Co/Zn/Cd) transporter
MQWSSRGIASEPLKQLLDHDLSTEEGQGMREIVAACSDLRDLHDLHTR